MDVGPTQHTLSWAFCHFLVDHLESSFFLMAQPLGAFLSIQGSVHASSFCLDIVQKVEGWLQTSKWRHQTSSSTADNTYSLCPASPSHQLKTAASVPWGFCPCGLVENANCNLIHVPSRLLSLPETKHFAPFYQPFQDDRHRVLLKSLFGSVWWPVLCLLEVSSPLFKSGATRFRSGVTDCGSCSGTSWIGCISTLER